MESAKCILKAISKFERKFRENKKNKPTKTKKTAAYIRNAIQS